MCVCVSFWQGGVQVVFLVLGEERARRNAEQLWDTGRSQCGGQGTRHPGGSAWPRTEGGMRAQHPCATGFP